MAARLPLSPREVLALDPEGGDRLLDQLERSVPVHPPFLPLTTNGLERAVVFGDTHGDYRSTECAVELWQEAPGRSLLVGLGDYIDRPPDDSPSGSVANALYLLGLAARFPDRVFLLQGNHETSRRIPVLPHTLPEEVDELWGPEEERYHRLVGLLERGPIAASMPNGAYLAHAGFPRSLPTPRWTEAFHDIGEDGLLQVVWSECDRSRGHRGVARPWGAFDLDAFLRRTGLSVILRGHDPDLCGRPLYGDRCLTLHTTRIYERYGGVIAATVPLSEPLSNVRPITVRHLSTEGRSFDDESN